MISYFDSSALVKRYVPTEPNGVLVIKFLQATPKIYTSITTTSEVRSAFRNKERSQEFTPAQVQKAVLDFNAHAQHQYVLLELTATMISFGNDLIMRYKLRTNDAYHIASAIEVANLANTPLTQLEFYTADKDQAAAAKAEGLTVILL